jgi:hypothetical protein
MPCVTPTLPDMRLSLRNRRTAAKLVLTFLISPEARGQRRLLAVETARAWVQCSLLHMCAIAAADDGSARTPVHRTYARVWATDSGGRHDHST